VKDTTFRGEFNIRYNNSSTKNPSTDTVFLEQPVELPIGKKHNGNVVFKVNEIRQIEVIEVGLFKKKNIEYDETQQSLPPFHTGRKKEKKKIKLAESKDLEPIEIQLKTYVIREPLQLKVLTKLIKEVEICGILLEGQNIGRDGIVAWIILTAGKTLIPFDIDALYEQVPDLWKTLEKSIFANDKLVKIIHDGRAAADYLWHVHRIKMVNVFDTQVADAFIAKEHMGYAPPQLSPLSDCLQMYNRRIPLEELDFLRKYENNDFIENSPLLKKPLPPPEYLKLCAIKVKHLVPLRENMIVKLMEKYHTCVDAHLSAFRDREHQDYLIACKKPRDVPRELLDILEEDLGQLIV